jgi:hypothetical protein
MREAEEFWDELLAAHQLTHWRTRSDSCYDFIILPRQHSSSLKKVCYEFSADQVLLQGNGFKQVWSAPGA